MTVFSLTRQSYMVLALLAVLAFFGNYFSLSVFFGVNFIFGNIAVLLVIYLFGAGWGILIALFASSYTFFLWGHPFAIVVYSLEALFIGFLWQRYTDKLLLLEGIFWMFLGLPLIWIFHIIFIPLDSTQMSLLLLKYLVNGIANASIARLIIMFLPLSQWAGLKHSKIFISLRQILLNIIIALVLLPAILTITVNGWLIVNQVEKDIKTQLNTLAEDITTDLRLQHQHIMQSLQKLVQLIAKEDLQYQDYIAQQAKQIGTLFPELVDIVLMDAQGKQILSYFNQYPNFNLNSLSSKEILQSVQHQAQIITFHTTLNKAGSNLPLMAHALPIQRNGQLIGILISYFNLNKSFYQEHIVQHTLTHHAHVSLTDNQGMIINTTRTDLKLLTAYDVTHDEREIWHNNYNNPKSMINSDLVPLKTGSHGEFTNHLGCLYISFPQKTTHTMLRWHEAVYVQYAQVDNNLPITVIVEIPLRNYLTSWQILYVKQLIMICIMVFLGILLAIIITNWLAGTLSKLANMTQGLSKRIEKNQVIQWPNCKICEINLLTNNFNAMAQSLQAHFDKIHTAKELLEQNVQKRTQELLHEHTLLRNLIDSIPDLICYKNNNGLYLGCNKAFEEFVGLRDVDLIGKTDFDVLPYEQAVFCIETDRHILKQRKPHRREKWVTYPNGDHILLETLKTPFFAYNGQFLGLIGISRDMTVHKQIEEALRQSQAMLRLVIDNIPQFIFWKDQQNVYLGCNQNFAQIVGMTSPQAIIGQRDEDLITDEQPANVLLFETLNRCISINSITNYQHIESVPLADGSQLWLEINNVPLQDNNGQVIGVLGSFEDITERKQAEEKLRQWVKVLENSAEAICITNANTQILQINKAFTKITGYTEADILGKLPSILSSGKHDAKFYKNLWKSIKTHGYWEGEIWDRRKNGEIYPEWLHISIIKNETNEQVTNYLGIFSDLTARKQTEQRLAYLAYYDDLTGLPNRTLFYERVNRAIYHARQNLSMVAVIFFDLDGFKYVNDTWGHPIGDLLLKKVAKRLMECTLCQSDAMARLGGDDFTMVLENINSPKLIEQFAHNILEVVQPPFDLNGHETFITASIGISLYPSDGKDVDTLLKQADAALYHAKESGKNNYQFFTPQMKNDAHNRLIMESKLRRALEREEFVLYYQPQMHLASGQIIGAEVLLRWQHPEMGLVSPYRFIPLAEETGLIVPIGEWVLHHTCLQQQSWKCHSQSKLRLSVNLSSRQFQQDNLIKTVVRILDETCMDATLLTLELTESLLIQNIDITNKILHQFKEMGIQLAIDDFGTGYSSLSYLKRFPIDKLKIDQSFVRDIPDNKDDVNITKAIIALAHNLQMTVVAEGVEKETQLILLKSLQCDEIQGYLISRPVPEEEFLNMFS